MCCGQGDFRPRINLNIELVHWEMARMLMSYSLLHTECVCHLVLLAKYFSDSGLFLQFSSTSDLGPKGRSSETSVAEMQSQHDNNPYGPTTRAALPSITAEQPVSNYSGKHMPSWPNQSKPWCALCSECQSLLLCRKPNNSRVRHPSHQARLLRILCLHTTHLLPQSLLDVLSTWAWGCAATVGRLCKEYHFVCLGSTQSD